MKSKLWKESTWMECLNDEKWWITGWQLFKKATFQRQYLVPILQCWLQNGAPIEPTVFIS